MTDERRHRSGPRRDERGAGLGSSLVIIALIAVAVMIVVGIIGVLSGADGSTSPRDGPAVIQTPPTPTQRGSI